MHVSCVYNMCKQNHVDSVETDTCGDIQYVLKIGSLRDSEVNIRYEGLFQAFVTMLCRLSNSKGQTNNLKK